MPAPVTTTPSLPERLPDLVASLGRTMVQAEDITIRADVPEKRAYRLTLDDGTTLKARLLLTEAHATSWGTLRRQVGNQPFLAALVAQSGRVVIEEWVEGTPLPMTGCALPLLQEAGQLLAHVHRLPAGAQPPGDAARRNQLEAALASLTALGALDVPRAAELSAIAARLSPGAGTPGVGHHDLTGPNLVRHSSRGLVSIDHEWMQVGLLELDLARALTEWDLHGASQDAFLAGYRAAHGPAQAGESGYWRLLSQVLAAEIRARRRWHDAPAALEQLRVWR